MAKTFKRTAEPVTLTEALSICLLLVEFETEVSNKRTRWYKELCQIRQILAELKSYYSEGETEMSTTSDMFFSRTKQTGQTEAQATENFRSMLERLTVEFNKLRESLAEIEARLTALEKPEQAEKAKRNGHNIKSFQADIVSHSKRVQR